MKIVTVRRSRNFFFFALFAWFCGGHHRRRPLVATARWPVNWLLQLDRGGARPRCSPPTIYAGPVTIFIAQAPFVQTHTALPGRWGSERGLGRRPLAQQVGTPNVCGVSAHSALHSFPSLNSYPHRSRSGV